MLRVAVTQSGVTAWDADPDFDETAGEEWLILLPQKWNCHVQYAWRYDPCELQAQSSARGTRGNACAPPCAPRAPVVDDCATDYGSEEEYVTVR